MRHFYLDLPRKHSILGHPIVSTVDNGDSRSKHATNGNEPATVNSIEMAAEEENVPRGLNSEIKQQLTANNSTAQKRQTLDFLVPPIHSTLP